jgi:hypothetical protein
MNRAWIPAGALAGVSVAGLIALGPLLTDSLGSDASFPTSVATPKPVSTAAFVPVSYNANRAVGQTSTSATFKSRGGQSQSQVQVAVNAAPADAGQVGYRRRITSTTHTSTAPTNVKPKPAKATPPKKRASSIGSVGESNGDSGFAGGSSNKTGLGEQTSTPGNGP